jgi:hypothetical protein
MMLVISLLLSAATPPAGVPDQKKLEQLQAQFAPVDIGADLSALDASERKALLKLVEAARLMDGLFLRQTWSGAASMLLELEADPTPLGRARLAYFVTNRGPWDRTDHDRAFIPGAPDRPGGANFYPEKAAKDEVEGWIKKLPGLERARANGFYTVIRRGLNGKFVIVPYALEYQNELERASSLLMEAAAATKEPTLKKFLEKRAKAFLTDDYYDSEVAWMELDSAIEPTIGPYEVYEDNWFNAKAAFEAFITVRDLEESKKLEKFAAELQGLENNLPIDAAYKNPKLGALAPIRVVNEVFASGDAQHGVQTAAYNLPNDERVTKEKGSKRVMLKNVQEAKFKRVLLPIAAVALAPEDQKKVAFDAFFTEILMHELMHGLGPHDVTVGGKKTTVRQALKEANSALEESKADISGLWAMQQLVDKGVIDKSIESSMYVTYLAGAFRSVRFGVAEAHGKGVAMQINYLLDHGAFAVGKDGRFSVDPAKAKVAVQGLTHEFMTIQAKGDYAAAKKMLDTLGVVRPEVQAVIDRLTSVPVDISPRFLSASGLESGSAARP